MAGPCFAVFRVSAETSRLPAVTRRVGPGSGGGARLAVWLSAAGPQQAWGLGNLHVVSPSGPAWAPSQHGPASKSGHLKRARQKAFLGPNLGGRRASYTKLHHTQEAPPKFKGRGHRPQHWMGTMSRSR